MTWGLKLFAYLMGLEQNPIVPHERLINRSSSYSKDKQRAFSSGSPGDCKLTVQGRGSTPFWSRRRQPVAGYWDASPWGRCVRKHETEKDLCRESNRRWRPDLFILWGTTETLVWIIQYKSHKTLRETWKKTKSNCCTILIYFYSNICSSCCKWKIHTVCCWKKRD